MEKQVINKVKTYFQHRPNVEGIWVSEDGHLFVKESAAKYYARFDNGRMRQKTLKIEYVRRVDVMKEQEKTVETEQKTNVTGTVSAEGTGQETETKTTETAEDKTKTAETNEAKTEETKATETVETEKQSKRKNRQKKSGTEQKTK